MWLNFDIFRFVYTIIQEYSCFSFAKKSHVASNALDIFAFQTVPVSFLLMLAES